MNENEEIIQIFLIFRHGKRNSFVNLDTGKIYETDLIKENTNITISKGRNFISKNFPNESKEIFNKNNFKCFISNSIRTIKTFLFRVYDFLPENNKNFFNYNEKDLKEICIKNFNADFNSKIFSSFEESNKIANFYTLKNSKYFEFLNEIQNELKKKNCLNLFLKYYNNETFEKRELKYFSLCIIYDFLNYSLDEDKKNFTKEHFEILDVFNKLNVNKKLMDLILKNKNVFVAYNYKLFEAIKNNLITVEKNYKKLIFFSAHDVYLCSFLNSLNFDVENKNYSFDDEIKIVVFKKKNKIFVKFFYNEENLKINFDENNKNVFEIEIEKFIDYINNNFLKFTYQNIIDFCEFKDKKDLITN